MQVVVKCVENCIPYYYYYYYYYYCGVKEFGNPGPFHIKPKDHVEEEEMSEDERRRSKLPRDIAEDNLVLDQLKS